MCMHKDTACSGLAPHTPFNQLYLSIKQVPKASQESAKTVNVGTKNNTKYLKKKITESSQQNHKVKHPQ